MSIQKQIEEARETLYRIDGPIASPEAMIIENAFMAIEAFISQQIAEADKREEKFKMLEQLAEKLGSEQDMRIKVLEAEIEQLKFGKSEVIPIIPFQTKIFELEAEIERLTQLLRKLDSLIDFSEHLDNGDWGIEDVSGINEVFDELKRSSEA